MQEQDQEQEGRRRQQQQQQEQENRKVEQQRLIVEAKVGIGGVFLLGSSVSLLMMCWPSRSSRLILRAGESGESVLKSRRGKLQDILSRAVVEKWTRGWKWLLRASSCCGHPDFIFRRGRVAM